MTGTITISNMTLTYPSMVAPIFKDVTMHIDESWKLGLIGRNGRGKTSFLNVLLGKVDYEGLVESSLTFTYFPTFPDEKSPITVEELLTKDNPHIELWEIDVELGKMDLPSDMMQKRFNELSAGEQTKVLLISTFLDQDSFPLIDEPTNNLDAHGREVVGQYLRHKSGYIVISHDQHFLNQFVDHVMAINKANIDVMKGNIDTWKQERERADARTEEQNQQLHKEIKRLNVVSKRVGDWGLQREHSTKDAAERRLAAKQMKRAKAIQKRTEEKLTEKQALIHNVEKSDRITMQVTHPKKQVVSLRDFTILKDGEPLFHPINVDMHPQDRLFIRGKNGVGKSTLIDFILGRRREEYKGSCTVRLPKELSVLRQQESLDADYASMIQGFSAEEKEAFFHMLHQLGSKRASFYDQTSEQWSAGEQKKLFLAHALLGNNALFVWDEVTNYLDVMVIDQLIEAMQAFEPTMIAVDHNDYYANAVATKTIKLVGVKN